MPDVQIRPFSDEHLDAAAGLLRDRHERHLGAEPLLARDVDYRAQLEAQEYGVVALRDGAVVAWQRDRHRVAERNGVVAGHALLYRRTRGDLRVPENSIDLALVVTRPDARGTGVGSALVAHALGLAHEHGFDAVTIDWRVVNLLADRFFRARGFRPTFVRLYRHVP
jgi:GNAT superfamily N-acetyltransferase